MTLNMVMVVAQLLLAPSEADDARGGLTVVV